MTVSWDNPPDLTEEVPGRIEREREGGRCTGKLKLVPADARRWAVALRHLLGLADDAPVSIVLSRPKRKRSDPQNRYFHGVLVPMVAEFLSAGRDMPISDDQAKYLIKASFIGVEETKLGQVPKHSSDQNTAEMSSLIDRVRAHFAAEGCYIPAPNERFEVEA